MTEQKTTVLIADANEDLALTLRSAIADENEFDVVGIATDGQQALDLMKRVRDRWTFVGEKLDMPLREAQHYLVGLGYEALAEKFADRVDVQPDANVFHLAQDRTLRIS